MSVLAITTRSGSLLLAADLDPAALADRSDGLLADVVHRDLEAHEAGVPGDGETTDPGTHDRHLHPSPRRFGSGPASAFRIAS